MTTYVLSVSDLDGRKRAARRVKALVRELTAAFGGRPPPHKLIMIRAAAEFSAASEMVRAAFLAGDGTVNSNDLVRAQNAAQRAIDALDIPASPAQTEDFDAEMRRLATPQEGAGAADASDAAEVADGSKEPMAGEMLPAEGVL